ncbi:MAG TPA: WecB/TagA/CpsF family glycosyltransferase [Ruminiclostridium sp.]|nr:WecB/TagA/CpsF family glycosyltransferase [Ruminiclostridium sp.]
MNSQPPKAHYFQSSSLLGTKIDAVNLQLATEYINSCIIHKHNCYVCVTPAHAVMDAYHSVDLRKIYNASGLSTPDGMAVVWYLRWKGYRTVERVYGPDLMLAVCQHSISSGYRHYFYGGDPCVTERLVANLQQRFPGLQVAGCWSPPFRPLSAEEQQADIERINVSAADIVWVGLGSPKQEIWMHAHRQQLDSPVLIGVGAAFDFLSGNKKQAPKWMQRNGLEWLFRLSTEPRRLWKRYIQYPLFILLVLGQETGILKFD